MEATNLDKKDDRVFISLGGKKNLGNYNSYPFDAGYSTTIRKGESVEEAFERCEKDLLYYVDNHYGKLLKHMEEIIKGKKPNNNNQIYW